MITQRLMILIHAALLCLPPDTHTHTHTHDQPREGEREREKEREKGGREGGSVCVCV